MQNDWTTRPSRGWRHCPFFWSSASTPFIISGGVDFGLSISSLNATIALIPVGHVVCVRDAIRHILFLHLHSRVYCRCHC
ncbi:uncharacterized protein P174DRAFT_194613 [Aspergillus novofumigatus IBT 16806]|uniref:Uncharacterized protein n=1 Tax=Aspergillus novofumigatus (strain IBT 16806) TaxID=1392255 RepID=A0A2I1CAV7_ASPN1|nr:uncharacterized protein P174DRAFT_194613 [Aspergillus novofumigatus IBT 16806]PKX94765.1 hypothetical protein P174DRAFT_194613 [Aspergillus novofumigatus IBT 16806]